MTAPARGILWSLALLCGASCSLLDKGKGLVFEENPEPEVEAGPALPLTIQERHPFVRFIEHGNGTFTAVMTVPAGAAAAMLPRLKDLCTMDDGYEPAVVEGQPPRNNPKLWSEANSGGIYASSALAKPWDAEVGTWKPTEDLILAKGTDSEIEEVLDAINLWYNAAPQIEIKASVFDVTNTDLFERGIVQADGQPLLENVQGNTFIRGLGGSFPSSSNPGFGAGKGPAGLGGVFRLGFIDQNFQLDAYLQFLEQEGVVDIVASPSVVTRNGLVATLQTTEDIPFLQPGAITFGGTFNYAVTTKQVGVTLNVVPFLVGADTVHLVINAEVSRLGREFVVGTDSNNNPITIPSTSRRTATTEVLVRSGQRVVIGGLKLRELRTAESGIPFLRHIPLLGWLFSSDGTDLTETEIYFVIEPNVKPVPTIEKIGDIFDPFAN